MRSCPLLVALIVLSPSLQAQPPQQRFPGPPAWAARDFLTAAALACASDSMEQVEILFRCRSTSLVALKGTSPTMPYARIGELTVELTDSTGTSHARDIERIEVAAEDPDSASAPLSWIERRFSFQIPRGNYHVAAELQDLQSRNRVARSAPLLSPPAGRDSFRALPVFITQGNRRQAGDTIRPQNFGDGVLFASSGSLLVQVVGIDPALKTATVSVRIQVLEAGERKPVFLREEKYPDLPLLFDRILSPQQGIAYTLQPASGKGCGAFVIVPLPLEQLPLRRYVMDCDVTVGTRHATFPVQASMIWPDQPESLRDVDYALESLRFITTPRILDSLQSGGFETRRDMLEQFWKERAGQRATADNPLMTEYYRRVDHAREHFATLKQQDGTRTDRGKIYILNGPPTRTDRTLDPVNGFTETWWYERNKKRVVFLDKNRDGNYTLVTGGSL